MSRDFYQVLQISKKASHQQVKQAYKRLALIHHPDKNEDKETAKVKFREISQAYAVLNDPEKRVTYDKYGRVDFNYDDLDFGNFMSNFDQFEEFLEQFLSFEDIEAMLSFMPEKQSKRNGKARGRAKGRSRGVGKKQLKQFEKLTKNMNNFTEFNLSEDLIEEAIIESLMKGEQVNLDKIMMNFGGEDIEKQLQKMMFGNLQEGEEEDEEEEDEEDEEDLTEEQLKILQFGQRNVTWKKISKKSKKKQLRCKIDNEKVNEDQILMHFSEKHMKQFRDWLTLGEQEKEKEKQQEIEY